ncbi:23S rRNA (adenine(2503)-C(2))-methyltransferase RlmN [Polluticoccus soli]|uniref:23S rRNA (adenine(2503)-C(2))-methyltransferase RlmN n=1 Tax=Polluticoccus soli TaxID=3034150 RepID=UPI0023E17BF2|nr:23S rRNA (adenine(2503)-C(2))-methyltransferase RlmN [Flavipsychrobacter sp. JY13-12]
MKNLRHLSLEDLEKLFKEWGEPKFRAKQVYEWMWKKFAGDISDMTNLSKPLREKLAEGYYIPKVKVHHSQFSSDGTIKNRLQLHDGHFIESVLIPTEKRMTVCVSSQVGCSLACKFCATGFLPRKRNVEFDEIVDEVVLANQQALEHYGKGLTNIVFMGMGEPLLNYKNVLKAIDMISSPDSLGMSPRRITVSTAGISKMIRQLGDDEVRFKLALSLHAANDRKRDEIMPINETSNLEDLVDALNYFYKKTKNEITFEYILFRDFNDSQKDADELVKLYRQVPVDLVNIIEYNPIEKADFIKPEEDVTDQFMHYLETKKVNARLRRSRGKDIDAACGQLANVDKANG